MGYPKPPTLEIVKVSSRQNRDTRQHLDRGYDDRGPFSGKPSRLSRSDYCGSKHGGNKHGGNKHGGNSHEVSEHDRRKHYETSGHRGKSSRGTHNYSDDYEDEEFSSEVDGSSDDYDSADDDFPKLSGLRGHLPKVNHDVAPSRPSVRATAPPSSRYSSLGSPSPNPGNYISRGRRTGSYVSQSGSGHGSSSSTAIRRQLTSGLRGIRPKKHHRSSSRHEHDLRIDSGGSLGYLSSLQSGSRRSAQYQSNSALPHGYSNHTATPRGAYSQGGVILQPAGANYGYNNIHVNPTAAAMGLVSVTVVQSYVQGQVGGQYWSNPVNQSGYWNHSPTPSVAPMGLTRITAGKQGKCCPRCDYPHHYNPW